MDKVMYIPSRGVRDEKIILSYARQSNLTHWAVWEILPANMPEFPNPLPAIWGVGPTPAKAQENAHYWYKHSDDCGDLHEKGIVRLTPNTKIKIGQPYLLKTTEKVFNDQSDGSGKGYIVVSQNTPGLYLVE